MIIPRSSGDWSRLIESEQPRMVVVGKAAGSAGAMMLMEDAKPDVVLLDLDLGDENGLDMIKELLKISAARGYWF